MPYTSDPRVDAYIDGLPGWQQDICREVRDLVHVPHGRRPSGREDQRTRAQCDVPADHR
jgi:hypothetical protein